MRWAIRCWSFRRNSRLAGMALALALLAGAGPCAEARAADGAEEAFESVVVIISGSSVGSGFAVGPDCIITNAHVVEDGPIVLQVYEGGVYDARIVAMDADADLAVLKIMGAELPGLPLADLGDTRIGDGVFAVGAPENMAYTLTRGIISSMDRRIDGRSYIQTDASINPGSSGGPLLNESWEVVGVTSMKLMDAEGLGLAIPISEVTRFMQDNGIIFDTEGLVEDDDTGGRDDEREASAAPEQQGGIGPKNALLVAVVALIITNLASVAIIAALTVRIRTLSRSGRPANDFDIDMDD